MGGPSGEANVEGPVTWTAAHRVARAATPSVQWSNDAIQALADGANAWLVETAAYTGLQRAETSNFGAPNRRIAKRDVEQATKRNRTAQEQWLEEACEAYAQALTRAGIVLPKLPPMPKVEY